MTIEELSQLTPEQKRVKIAESCPQVAWQDKDGHWMMHWDSGVIAFDPLGDLNAIQAAWCELTLLQKLEFQTNLQNFLWLGDPNAWLVGAEAAQRADAYLFTVCKWPELSTNPTNYEH